MKKYFFILIVLSTSVNTFSQNNDLFAEIRLSVRQFQDAVGELAGNEYTPKEKDEIYKNALPLFMGDCDEYVEYQDFGDYVMEYKKNVMIVIRPSKRTESERPMEMKKYLLGLRKSRYKKVKIESSEVIKIDKNIRPIGKDESGRERYVTTAHYLQKYSAYKNEEMKNPSYWDYSNKSVEIYITKIETDNPLTGEVTITWEIRLGDVATTEIM